MNNLKDGKLRVAAHKSVLGKNAHGKRKLFRPGEEIGPGDLSESEKAQLIDEGALVWDGYSFEQLQAQAEAHGFKQHVDFERNDGSVDAPPVPTDRVHAMVEQADRGHLRPGEKAPDAIRGAAPHTPQVADEVDTILSQRDRKPHSVNIKRPALESEKEAPEAMDDLEG